MTHSRRPGGANQADEGDVDGSDMRRGGRWNRDKMESCYLSQLPKRLMRVLAGFSKEKGSFFLPRGNQDVPEALQNQVYNELTRGVPLARKGSRRAHHRGKRYGGAVLLAVDEILTNRVDPGRSYSNRKVSKKPCIPAPTFFE